MTTFCRTSRDGMDGPRPDRTSAPRPSRPRLSAHLTLQPELVAAVNGFLSTIPEGWLSAGKAEDVQSALDAGAITLDVRTAGEYEKGNLEGSLNIDLRELATGIEGVSTSSNVITYCGSGHRSAMAVAALHVLGANNAKAYGGSYTSLVDAGLPVTTP